MRSESSYQTQEKELGTVVWALATDLLMALQYSADLFDVQQKPDI